MLVSGKSGVSRRARHGCERQVASTTGAIAGRAARPTVLLPKFAKDFRLGNFARKISNIFR